MKNLRILIALLLAHLLATSAPLFAVDMVGTLPLGLYACEWPGDATGPVGRHAPEQDFTVVTGSSYEAGGAIGTYLLSGESLVMTSGPKQGQKFHRLSLGFLRLVKADGADGDLRCFRQGRN